MVFASAPSASSARAIFTLSSQLEWLDRPRPITVARTDDADGADGIFSTRARAPPGHSGACRPFARDVDLEAQRRENRLPPPQSPGKRPRIFCPGRAVRDVNARMLRTQAQELGRASGPYGPVDHECTHANGHR